MEGGRGREGGGCDPDEGFQGGSCGATSERERERERRGRSREGAAQPDESELARGRPSSSSFARTLAASSRPLLNAAMGKSTVPPPTTILPSSPPRHQPSSPPSATSTTRPKFAPPPRLEQPSPPCRTSHPPDRATRPFAPVDERARDLRRLPLELEPAARDLAPRACLGSLAASGPLCTARRRACVERRAPRQHETFSRAAGGLWAAAAAACTTTTRTLELTRPLSPSCSRR